jgi:signal transduction histidine kinase
VDRLSPVHWRLRSKLVAALLVPAVLAVALSYLRIDELRTRAAEYDRVARFATVQGTVADLVERIGEERYRAAAFVTGRVDELGLRTTTAEVDRAAATTFAEVAVLTADDPTLVEAQRRAEEALAGLPRARAALTGPAPATAEVLADYSQMVDRVDDLESAILRGVDAPQSSGLALALERLSAVRNEVSVQYALVTAGTAVPEQPLQLWASEARLTAGITEARSALGPAAAAVGDRLGEELVRSNRADLVREAVVEGTSETGQNVRVIFDAALFRVDDAQRAVRAELTGVSERTRSDAMSQALLNAVVLGIAVLVGIVLIALITRAMVRSLQVLRTSAMRIASTTLPETVHALQEGRASRVVVAPVPVRSREEIGEVARSFDAVHTQAVRLAEEQAMLQTDVKNLFVNLSRRSQSLVDQQLELIEELARTEPDPERLARFRRLDHLGTRMRRNSENLLVLGGTDMTKRAVQSIELTAVLQAAAAEVEQSGRIVIRSTPAVTLAGRVAADLQHLLSELLDNSASFSPPGSRILVTAFRPPGRPLYIDVTDFGLGMTPDERAEANRMLRKHKEASADVARRMGFFVVRRLAERHGIGVQFIDGYLNEDAGSVTRASATPGLTARVTVPQDLFGAGRPDAFGPDARLGTRSPGAGPDAAPAVAGPVRGASG